MYYEFPRFNTHLQLTYFDDFDQNHYFWSLIPLEPNVFEGPILYVQNKILILEKSPFYEP
jgi:hypothetical protein